MYSTVQCTTIQDICTIKASILDQTCTSIEQGSNNKILINAGYIITYTEKLR